MITIGLDASLTGTGVCVLETEGSEILGIKKVCTIGSALFGVERLVYIRDAVKAITVEYPAPVFIEGYSFGSKGASVYGLGELGGVLRVMLYESHVNYREIAPTLLKKYISGKGNGKKEIMLEQTYRRFGFGSEVLQDNNQVDAFGLAIMCANFRHYQQYPEKYTKDQATIFDRMLEKDSDED